MKNKCVKFDENSISSTEAMAMSVFFKVLKGRLFYQSILQIMSFGQNVALVMVNKFVKFDEKSLSFVKVMAEIS